MTDQRMRDLVDEIAEKPLEFFLNTNYGITVESDMDYIFLGCKILLGGNGPSIIIDTRTGYVVGTTSSDRYEVAVDHSIVEEVHSYYKERWYANL